MVRVCRTLPKEWEKYEPIGSVIPRTRFIVFKTPLNDRLLTKVSKENRFNVSHLLRKLAESGQHLGMVIDLTDTDRYYDKADIEGMCIEYKKISCPGRGFIDNEEHVVAFNRAIQKYTENFHDSEALIGIHCTDGINRSGYLICRFLIENLGWSSHEALEAFERARGYPIANGAYVQELHRAAKRARENASRKAEGNKGEESGSDSDGRRKKKKKMKRKRDMEDEEEAGTLMRQFLGELEQQAQEIESGSGYGSPAINAVPFMDSTVQQHWAYAKRPKTEEKPKPPPSIENYEEEEDDGEGGDEEGLEEGLDEVADQSTLSKAQKRRLRRAKQQNMLNVMKRGNFHEIREMQEDYLRKAGAAL